MAVKDGIQMHDGDVRSFLMIGQSNMAERGEIFRSNGGQAG